jgi:D-lactate dehydrogenase
MKMAIFEVEAWERETFEGLEQEHELVFRQGRLRSATLHDHGLADIADAEVISTFIYSELDRDVLKEFSDLRLIATRSTGFDHIDMEYCRENHIAVANVPSYGENTVAEHVFALLLAISHHLVEAVDRTRRGDFSQDGLRGFDLLGKTMGVVGAGNIGQHVIRMANGFGMNVIAFDVRPDEEAARRLEFDYVDFHDLLGRSDVVTLHVPAIKDTQDMIAEDEFNSMKDGVVLINTARGSIVNTRALLHALSEGKVAAAGLDVLTEEPVLREEAELLRSAYSAEHDLRALLADHILLRLRNVIITPHSAFNTREAVQRILTTTRGNIDAYLAGAPTNIVA